MTRTILATCHKVNAAKLRFRSLIQSLDDPKRAKAFISGTWMDTRDGELVFLDHIMLEVDLMAGLWRDAAITGLSIDGQPSCTVCLPKWSTPNTGTIHITLEV